MLSLWQYSREHVPSDRAITCLIHWTQKEQFENSYQYQSYRKCFTSKLGGLAP